jgi:hypothetical protein
MCLSSVSTAPSLARDFIACSCSIIRQSAYREASRELETTIIAAKSFGAAVREVFHATHTEDKPACSTCLPHIGQAIVETLSEKHPYLKDAYDAWKVRKFKEETPDTPMQKSGCNNCGGCKALAFNLNP